MKEKVSKPTKRALEKAAKAKFEQQLLVAEARQQERDAQQRQADRQFIADFFRAVDAATELPDSTILMACMFVGGGYRDIKIPMDSLRRLSAIVRRLST